jgi:hypothetical protein
VFGGSVDAVAARLATAAADAFVGQYDAFVGQYDGGEEAGAFDGIAFGIDQGADAREFNRVIAGAGAFIDTELAGFLLGKGDAGF